MIDILPTLALATPKHSPDKATIRAWSLVLTSRRFLNRSDHGRLLVAPALAALAVQEIIAYEQENLPRPRPAPLPDNSWVSLLVIAVFLGLTMWLDAQGLGRRISWHLAGRADAGLILGGEWWRCVTALFLLRHFLDLGRGPDVEPDDDGIGGRCQQNVGFGDGPGTAVDEGDLDLVRGQLAQGFGDCFKGALHVGLQKQVEVLGLFACLGTC